ncbi:MAG: hypothetical protein R3245_02365 [Kiloniellales bacterium]|nr:hypothetical protein [Kiloniellales bacterium]
MPSHAEVAAKLLRDAANFFLAVGEQNPELSEEMKINAKTFHTVAGLVETDPEGDCLFVDKD